MSNVIRNIARAIGDWAGRGDVARLTDAVTALHDEVARKAVSTAARLDRLEAAHLAQMDLGVVASYGSSGTTLLVNFFQLYSPLLINPPVPVLSGGGLARYRLKHLPAPPCSANLNRYLPDHCKELEQSQIDFSRIQRALYVYADPSDVVLSIFRREQQFPGFMNFHLDNIGSLFRFEAGASVESYLACGEDVFGLEQHFNAWMEGCVHYPIMLVKYSAIWTKLAEVCDFMRVPGKVLSLFPAQRPRTNSTQMCTDAQRERLECQFATLLERQRVCPDILIVDKKNCQLPA